MMDKEFGIKRDSYLEQLINRKHRGSYVSNYFMDMGLRNERINYRQQEVTHAMENVIYNELRVRGFKVDVGNLNIIEKGEDGKKVKKLGGKSYLLFRLYKKYLIEQGVDESCILEIPLDDEYEDYRDRKKISQYIRENTEEKDKLYYTGTS